MYKSYKIKSFLMKDQSFSELYEVIPFCRLVERSSKANEWPVMSMTLAISSSVSIFAVGGCKNSTHGELVMNIF